MKSECPNYKARLKGRLLNRVKDLSAIKARENKYTYFVSCPTCQETLGLNTHPEENKYKLLMLPVFICLIVLNILAISIEINQNSLLFSSIIAISIFSVLYTLYAYYRLNKNIPADWPRYLSLDQIKHIKDTDAEN